VASVLPGGSKNALYNGWLDRVAEFLGSLKGKNGESIPIVLRLFHELNGGWFWWGKDQCSPDEMKNLWRYTILYLRNEKKLHNLLYTFNTDKFNSGTEYIERYPGDDLIDMIAAIRWVKKNISAFGGDPNRITIAGQSAGSASVNCLLASPAARGLFQGAIGESGSYVLENPILRMNSLASAEKEGLRIANKLNATDLKALRAIPADELQKNAGGFFAPIVDGYLLPVSVSETYKTNQQIHVPLLTGWNGDEGFIFGIASKENFAKQAAEFGTDSNLFKKYFPSATDSQSVASQISLAVDKTIGISQYQWALKQNENSKSNTYLYLFTRRPPATGDKKKFGAYHTAEIGYALHTLDSIQRVWEPVDRELEKLMSAYWVQFVKTGNPNLPGLPEWGMFSDHEPHSMIFGDTSIARLLPDKEALDFLYKNYPGK